MRGVKFFIIIFVFSIFVILFFSLWPRKKLIAPPPSLTPEIQILPPQKGDPIISLETTHGVIRFKLYPEFAPENSKNFQELVRRGFYDGLTFHRIINGFMIQGGDPRGDSTGGESYLGPDKTLPDEISVLRHIRGAVSMANRGPNTATSQFFIVQGSQGAHWLDSKYTVFGQVFEGISVVDQIAKVEVDALNKPVNPVKIMKATASTF